MSRFKSTTSPTPFELTRYRNWQGALSRCVEEIVQPERTYSEIEDYKRRIKNLRSSIRYFHFQYRGKFN